MIEGIVFALIYICVAALVIWIILWVLNSVVGVALPAQVVKIVWVIFALLALLWLLRAVLPGLGVALP
jgi:formate hydrogenlyase subunit 4